MAVVQHLQKDIEHVGMRLLDFIEKHDGIRVTAHLLRKLAPVVKAHISGRGTDQLGNGMSLHILGHIDPDQGVFASEHGFRQRFAQLRLSHARGTKKQERADGPLRILKSHTSSSHGPRHRRNGFLLADHPLMQNRLQLHEPFAFLFLQPAHRNFRPGRNHLRHIVFRDHVAAFRLLFLKPRFLLRQLLHHGVLLPLPVPGLLKGLQADRVLDLLIQFMNLLIQQPDVLRLFHIRQLHRRSGFIDQIDGLIRQPSVVDISAGKAHGRFQRTGFIGDLMMLLIAGSDSLQNADRLLFRGFFHVNRLEPSFQRGVPFNILPVLRDRGRADELQLAASEGGLQDIGSVDRPFRSSCADQRMKLIQEQKHVSGFRHLADHLLNPFLKFSPVFASCDHSGKVQGKNPFVLHGIRHVSFHNPAGKPFHNGGFSDAGLSHQAGIILRPSGQDLDHTADLFLSAHNRVQLPCGSQSGHIPAVLLQSGGLPLLFLLLHKIFLVQTGILPHRRKGIRIDLLRLEAAGI